MIFTIQLDYDARTRFYLKLPPSPSSLHFLHPDPSADHEEPVRQGLARTRAQSWPRACGGPAGEGSEVTENGPLVYTAVNRKTLVR